MLMCVMIVTLAKLTASNVTLSTFEEINFDGLASGKYMPMI